MWSDPDLFTAMPNKIQGSNSMWHRPGFHKFPPPQKTKLRSHLKILGSRRVTESKFHTEDRQISVATLQNYSSRRPGALVQPWHGPRRTVHGKRNCLLNHLKNKIILNSVAFILYRKQRFYLTRCLMLFKILKTLIFGGVRNTKM